MSTRVEIQCVNKEMSLETHRRIVFVGGSVGRSRWKLSQGRAMDLIESNISSFYVERHGKTIDVEVAFTEYGQRYLKTAGSRKDTNYLLDLPQCP